MIMAKQNPKFKLYLTNGDASKTITESHPKLDSEIAAKTWSNLDDHFTANYEMGLNEVTVQSETTVYAAS